VLAVAIATAPGCVPVFYVANVISASSGVHAAEEQGAPEWAPYQYWLAHEYLDKAAEEANEGNYMDATRFAERATDLSRQAQELTTQRRREADEARASGGEQTEP
jgi:hypothetical protein